MQSITVTVNGKTYTRDVEPRLLLVDFIRDTLGLTGTNIACDTSQCGCVPSTWTGWPLSHARFWPYRPTAAH